MPTIVCPKCSEPLEIDGESVGERVECGACHFVFIATAPRPSSRHDDGSRPTRRDRDDGDDYRSRPPRRRTVPRHGTQGMGIASMVCGIIGLVGACCGSVSLLVIPLDIVAVVLGILSLKTAGKGFGTAGLVCGGIGLVGAVGYRLLFGFGRMGLMRGLADFF